MNGVYVLPHRLGICFWVNLIDLGYFNFDDPLIKSTESSMEGYSHQKPLEMSLLPRHQANAQWDDSRKWVWVWYGCDLFALPGQLPVLNWNEFLGFARAPG